MQCLSALPEGVECGGSGVVGWDAVLVSLHMANGVFSLKVGLCPLFVVLVAGLVTWLFRRSSCSDD